MDKWRLEIDYLVTAGCRWTGPPQDQKKIVDLIKSFGADPDLEPHDTAYLLDQVKNQLGCPKKVSEPLLSATSAQAFPMPPPPEGDVEASEQPVDLQAAELIYQDHDQLIAERAWALFLYSAVNGYWGLWPDTPAKKAAQQALQRLVVVRTGEWARPYGTSSHVKATVDQLKVLTSGGTFSEAQQPQVIVFLNGTYDLKTHKLEEHSPHHGATYGLAADYIRAASCPKELRAVIDRCYPYGIEAIVRALIRWLIDPSIRYGEAFHFLGDTGTGKGLLIDFLRSLLPASVIGQLLHPADLSSPEKIHQYVVGRRLVAFPDVPANLIRRDGDSCNLFYEMVENKPMTTRKLNAGESETSTPMHCRFILGSVRPLQFKDGRDGYLRRIITIKTLPRSGSPDATLREQLNPTGPRFDQIRAEAISWALAMPLDEVNAVLDSNDPEGLLRDAAQEAAVASDLVSQWADRCLEPSSPDLVVSDIDWGEMYESFAAWGQHEGVNRNYVTRRTNFQGQVRKILGPDRCLERQIKTKLEQQLDGSSDRWWPRVDAGFMLRIGLIKRGVHDPVGTPLAQGSFNASAMREGGLALIAEMRAAQRTGLNPINHTPCTGPAQGTCTGQHDRRDTLQRNAPIPRW
jgi:hypothetical protein